MSDQDFINKSMDKQTNKQKDFINKLINKSIIVKSISFRKEHFPILFQFIEKARLERSSSASKTGFSELAIKAFSEYLQRHPLPNPQTILEHFSLTGLPAKPAWQCCVPNCNNKARFQLILKDFQGKTETFRVCQVHRKWKHNRFRFLVGFGEIRKQLGVEK